MGLRYLEPELNLGISIGFPYIFFIVYLVAPNCLGPLFITGSI